MLFVELFGFVDECHQHCVLVLDVGLLLLHLALQDQVAQIPFLGKPDEEFAEGCLDGSFPGLRCHEEAGDVAGPSDSFYFAEEVGLGGGVVAAVLVAEHVHLGLVGIADVLPDDLLRDIPANILPVVARLLHLALLLLRLENLRQDLLVVDGGREGEEEGSFAVDGGADEFVENGVVGFLAGQPVGGEEVGLRVLEVKLMLSH